MPSIKVRKYGNSVYVIYSHGHRKFKIFTGVKVETEFMSLSYPFLFIIISLKSDLSNLLNPNNK